MLKLFDISKLKIQYFNSPNISKLSPYAASVDKYHVNKYRDTTEGGFYYI